jgi:hypothetical protein
MIPLLFLFLLNVDLLRLFIMCSSAVVGGGGVLLLEPLVEKQAPISCKLTKLK